MKASWRSKATDIASGAASHKAVEPSMSLKRKVTVPEGNPRCHERPIAPGISLTRRSQVSEFGAHRADADTNVRLVVGIRIAH
jgi:hypothetical protein